MKPKFEEQHLPLSNEAAVEIHIEAVTSGILLPSQETKTGKAPMKQDGNKRKREATVLGPDSAGEGIMVGGFQTGARGALRLESSSMVEDDIMGVRPRQKRRYSEGGSSAVDGGALEVSDTDLQGTGASSRCPVCVFL